MTAYKVAFAVDEQSVPKYYEKITERINEYNEDNNNVLPVPATYLIDESGKISYVHYDPDYKNRSDLDEILKSL
jgi:peroxiredoxin